MRQASLIILWILALAMMPTQVHSADVPSPRTPARQAQRKSDPKSTEADDGPGLVRAGPAQSGDVEPKYWQDLTEDQQAQAVSLLKTFAQKSSEKLKHPLRLHESKLFLFFSDLSENDAVRYLSLLERMYGKLAELFGFDRGQNLWRGKALVLVFTRIEDYRLYERLVEGIDPGGSFGMTHCYGDGLVHMAFYRYPNDTQFAHLLVHESVHGLLHRYRTPVRIPSWANEGLAEEVASELVPDPSHNKSMPPLLRSGLAQHNHSVGDFFTSRQIDGWQYPLAESLCAWMIRHDRKGYLQFINGIKDGQSWDESLKSNFKMTRERMMSEYAKSAGIKKLKIP